MKTVRIINERWFRTAPFHDVKMLGIKFLGVPADRFVSTQTENFKRALVRQMYNKQYGEYGKEFEIPESSNPFGAPKRRRSKVYPVFVGEYRFVKNGLRAQKEDIRWQMMEVVKKNTTFEAAIEEFANQYGSNTKFKTAGKLEFDFQGMLGWAEKLGWIMRV